MTWSALVEQWALLESDWASEYGSRLHAEWQSLSWREFAALVTGLMAADTRLARHFAARAEVDDDVGAEVSDEW